jgi:hypothetical protein
MVPEHREGNQDAKITFEDEFLSSLEKQQTRETQIHGTISKDEMDIGEQGGTKLP